MSEAEIIDAIRHFQELQVGDLLRQSKDPARVHQPAHAAYWHLVFQTVGVCARRDQPQFEANGGSVMVVIVHSGHLLFDSIYVSSQPPYFGGGTEAATSLRQWYQE
ncbi:hypothetical protein PLEOSDRAFT_170753 [Pleurotus ostreatus PC15]|uniref:Uncharacterized protein n=1 Tax=Pleurotus ostreatus (strain PC15) TaxID=1137138 RepID=A0A067NJ54_PLEO1|nr:hypothetical protein PLEOSDRAFT_170753 [Pleurotus ostreatus PC15]